MLVLLELLPPSWLRCARVHLQRDLMLSSEEDEERERSPAASAKPCQTVSCVQSSHTPAANTCTLVHEHAASLSHTHLNVDTETDTDTGIDRQTDT